MVGGRRADEEVEVGDELARIPQQLAGAGEALHDRVREENQAEAVEEAGEEKAEAIDDTDNSAAAGNAANGM